MVVRDDITNAVSKLVGAQMQKQLNHFEQTGYMAGINYKFGMYIETLDGSNAESSSSIVEQWFVEGCFLSNVSYDALDYADSNPMTITTQVRYDNAQYWGYGGSEVTMPNPAPILRLS